MNVPKELSIFAPDDIDLTMSREGIEVSETIGFSSERDTNQFYALILFKSTKGLRANALPLESCLWPTHADLRFVSQTERETL